MVNRRTFIVSSLVSLISASFNKLFAAAIQLPSGAVNPDVKYLASLPAFLDTLIPEYLGPSASQLGIEKHILDKALSNSQYMTLVVNGCKWLDIIARKNGYKSFSEMPLEYREKIVAAAESSEKTIARQFFLLLQRDAFKFYYSKAESWQYLNYQGPPQPRGFTDYTRPTDPSA